MAATIMPSIISLIKTLQHDFPDIHFIKGSDFKWSFETRTINYNPSDPTAAEHLLHELAHASLEHHDYSKDIQLIEMEREAWSYTSTTLSGRYHIPIHDEIQQAALDSYRDWMHARSTCPRCKATGIEITTSIYHCPACQHEWRVNEARMCGLKRYAIKK